MITVFETVLRNCMPVSLMIAAVMVLRLILRKSPKWIIVLLWVSVGIRMVLPCPIPVSFSPIPSGEAFSETLHEWTIREGSGTEEILDSPFESLRETEWESYREEPVSMRTISFLPLFWAAGFLALLTYALVSVLCLYRRTFEAVSMGEYRLCDRIETPFILGLIHPAILIPAGVSEADLPCILAHEKAHLARYDHWTKWIGFLLVSAYWFHPLVWIAYHLMNRDIEMACDEKAVRDYTMAERKAYSNALLACASAQKAAFPCPPSFAEGSVKERIRNVLNYRKPKGWVSVLSFMICLILSGCFMSEKTGSQEFNAKSAEESGTGETHMQEESTSSSVPVTVITLSPGFIYPLSCWQETCGYDCYAFHYAQDFSDPENDHADVYASKDGTVLETGWNEIEGNYVMIGHDENCYTLYASLGEVIVKAEEEVKQGQKIGEIGISGQSTGSHVHFAIRRIPEPDNLLDHFRHEYKKDEILLPDEKPGILVRD